MAAGMTRRPELRVFDDAGVAARNAAGFLNGCIAASPGVFTLALSGGRSPWVMLQAWVQTQPPWQRLRLFQVDERNAPRGHKARNLTALQQLLPEQARLYPLPVEEGGEAAISDADRLLREQLPNGVFDLVHLGLGADGHTASLVPNDPVLDVSDSSTAWSGDYQGRRRLTLTYPVLDGARQVFFLVTGEDKREALQRLLDSDPRIPAGRLRNPNITVFADRAAAASVT